jgi:hypothetical protein
MFTELDYRAAAVRDAVRHLNEAIERVHKTGLTFSVRIEDRQPVRVTVEESRVRNR